MAELTRRVAEGQIAPRIDTRYPFDRAVEAISRLDARRILGKLVVVT